ncbi:hypothetical protein HRS9122_00002 [Pyrenophora teres f. teres]|nr:hypothetical protein HRS9122_00002 [Pyrenophora teres f. teres]
MTGKSRRPPPKKTRTGPTPSTDEDSKDEKLFNPHEPEVETEEEPSLPPISIKGLTADQIIQAYIQDMEKTAKDVEASED